MFSGLHQLQKQGNKNPQEAGFQFCISPEHLRLTEATVVEAVQMAPRTRQVP